MFNRRSSFFTLLLVALLVLSCQKEYAPAMEQPAPAPAPEYTKYIIPAGAQFNTNNPFTPIEVDELKFMVRFDSSAIYTTQDTLNQYDVNKLYGFADNNQHHNLYSARFGWRWMKGELHLFSYIYNDGIRADTDIGKIEIGREYTCSIKVAGTQYIFTLDGQVTKWPRKSTTARAIGYKLYPFFGGDEVAPHTIHIWIKEL